MNPQSKIGGETRRFQHISTDWAARCRTAEITRGIRLKLSYHGLEIRGLSQWKTAQHDATVLHNQLLESRPVGAKPMHKCRAMREDHTVCRLDEKRETGVREHAAANFITRQLGIHEARAGDRGQSPMR